jgi:hypothetical protein
MKIPGLGSMNEVELKTTALLRAQQLLHCRRREQNRRSEEHQLEAHINPNVPVPSSLASSRTTSASTWRARAQAAQPMRFSSLRIIINPICSKESACWPLRQEQASNARNAAVEPVSFAEMNRLDRLDHLCGT